MEKATQPFPPQSLTVGTGINLTRRAPEESGSALGEKELDSGMPEGMMLISDPRAEGVGQGKGGCRGQEW